jgi:hypothetical protein
VSGPDGRDPQGARSGDDGQRFDCLLGQMSNWNYSSTEELEADGYTFLNESRCRGAKCGAMIAWWQTPKGNRIPLDPDTLEPHFSTCPDRQEFKK